MTTATPSLTRLTGAIGARLDGADLRAMPDDATTALLRASIAEHHVIVLSDQFLSAEQLGDTASAFGPMMASPAQLVAGTARPGVTTIEDTADRPPAGFAWHTDLSWTTHPPSFGFLCAVKIPPYGGDTIWTSTADVFDALGAPDRRRCEAMQVTHLPGDDMLATVVRHHGAAAADRLRREHAGCVHPLVRVHPVTGRRNLFLSPLYTRGVVGADRAENALLARLHTMLDDPTFQLRWRWREGDVIIWDETSTCHRALTDHHPQHRVMRRCVTGTW